jgi:hypothetical protein
VRVGRVLVHVSDREALGLSSSKPAASSWLDAWQEAAELADKALGVVLPPLAYKPRSSR